MKQWLKDFVHNCVVHPMMPFLPVKLANCLHDKNATWAFRLNRLDEIELEKSSASTTFIKVDERSVIKGDEIWTH